MKYIINVYYTLPGKDMVIPFVAEIDDSLPGYEQCQKCVEIGKTLCAGIIDKNAKNIRFRTFEVGVPGFNLN